MVMFSYPFERQSKVRGQIISLLAGVRNIEMVAQ